MNDMKTITEKLFTKAEPQTRMGKIIQFPLTRIILAILFLAPVSVINNLVAAYGTEKLSGIYYLVSNGLLSLLCFFLFLYAYRLYCKHIEKRAAYEISARNSLKELGNGLLIGLTLVALTVGVFVLLKIYNIESINSWTVILNAIVIFGMGSFAQELLIRGILFRVIEEFLGSWLTIIIVALIFGLAHLGNENASPLTSFYLFIADLLLSAAFIYTRRLWLVWGIHFGWNLFQDGIFGMPNSGITSLPSLINPSIDGPEWITGGSFGIEASVIAVVLSLAVGIIILKKAWDIDLFVKPVWKRKLVLNKSEE